MTKAYVLDACALIAFLNDEDGAAQVESVIRAAEAGQSLVYVNKTNLLEVYYDVYRAEGKERAGQVLQALRELPISIVEGLEDRVFAEAGRMKATYRISLADAIALAEARTRKAELVTSDHHEFDVIEKKEDISFHWIR